MAPQTIMAVWTDSALLSYGLRFSIPVLIILLCHELGHYLACRYYRLPATLPYFLPAPFALGTLGAFIRIKAPIRRKVELFDVGIAGPLAGFVALLPFLTYGMWRSSLGTVKLASHTEEVVAQLFVPGQNLAITLLTRVMHGPVTADTVVDFHPFALAAWIGMLATALNLLPMGQLDGGHILFALSGRHQKWLGPTCWTALAMAGTLWTGWWLWCIILLVMGMRHPPISDPEQPLDAARKWIAVAAFIIFFLVFVPVPLSIQYLAQQ
jgi:membrane-associated protease RseP (regulator of RpoE activity)